jgi:transposase
MLIFGIDAHRRSHTVVVVDGNGRRLGARTFGTTSADHLQLLRWAEQFGAVRQWAVEDRRHLSRRLERDLLAAGQQIVRVPPKLMAHVRELRPDLRKVRPDRRLSRRASSAREPDLPVARRNGTDRDVRLLADHRDALVADRTRTINRLRWHLHELDPGWEPARGR